MFGFCCIVEGNRGSKEVCNSRGRETRRASSSKRDNFESSETVSLSSSKVPDQGNCLNFERSLAEASLSLPQRPCLSADRARIRCTKTEHNLLMNYIPPVSVVPVSGCQHLTLADEDNSWLVVRMWENGKFGNDQQPFGPRARNLMRDILIQMILVISEREQRVDSQRTQSLIPYCLRTVQRAPGHMLGEHWPCNYALLNQQGVRAHPEHQSPQIGGGPLD